MKWEKGQQGKDKIKAKEGQKNTSSPK